MTDAELIAAIKRHAEATGLAPATVTSRAVGNSRLYANLIEGKSCTLRVANRLREYISSSAPSTPTLTSEN